MPTFDIEKSLNCTGAIIGIDEAGRGPWAGPVVAAAVSFPDLKIDDNLLKYIDDSKKLSAKKREMLYPLIMQSNAIIGVGMASVEEIDTHNILQATFMAMQRAVENIQNQGIIPAYLLIDGNRLPKNNPIPAQSVIKGDSLSLSIAAASIIAKVARDKIMQDYALIHPPYGWEKNAGYGTAHHITAINHHGLTPHHRKSYAPIKKYIEMGKI